MNFTQKLMTYYDAVTPMFRGHIDTNANRKRPVSKLTVCLGALVALLGFQQGAYADSHYASSNSHNIVAGVVAGLAVGAILHQNEYDHRPARYHTRVHNNHHRHNSHYRQHHHYRKHHNHRKHWGHHGYYHWEKRHRVKHHGHKHHGHKHHGHKHHGHRHHGYKHHEYKHRAHYSEHRATKSVRQQHEPRRHRTQSNGNRFSDGRPVRAERARSVSKQSL